MKDYSIVSARSDTTVDVKRLSCNEKSRNRCNGVEKYSKVDYADSSASMLQIARHCVASKRSLDGAGLGRAETGLSNAMPTIAANQQVNGRKSKRICRLHF